MADVCALVSALPPADLAGLLTAALRRLADWAALRPISRRAAPATPSGRPGRRSGGRPAGQPPDRIIG